MYIRIISKKVRNQDWDVFDDDHCPGNFCPRIEILIKLDEVTYTPCYQPTLEELTTDIYLQTIERENCELPSQTLEMDWGAGDTQEAKDGQWGEWSSWAHCCKRGDEKLQTYRKRECDNPKPYLDGSTCLGQEVEIMECQRPCPTNGRFTTWSRWSDCFCDGIAVGSYGVKTRMRQCEGTSNGGKFCWGVLQQSAPCSGDC